MVANNDVSFDKPDTMITEIFTGHAIDLRDMRAISGVMCESRPTSPFCWQTLFVTINLKDGVTIRHEAMKLQTFHNFELEPRQKEQWDKAFDELTEKRNNLVKQWESAKQVGEWN